MDWNIINSEKDLPEPKKRVLFASTPPNKKFWKVTVGYYEENNKEYGGPCWRDELKNSYYFDDSFKPATVELSYVSKWMDFPEIN